ncbi:hypothetical protein AB0H76_17200 [Nocardia sp. NPDC050712]|uniref:hypothetical protein n=1 Tax=Nocardia sp. NPDC050712 TaxID=3155518 RepID=UPI0033ED2E1E
MSEGDEPATVVREILNYFGKCPACGYPARATEVSAPSVRTGEVVVTISATCDLPCGWSGVVPRTIMTRR